MENVTMICPDKGTWYKKNGQELGEREARKEHTQKYDNDMKGLYHCEFDNRKYYFYVQGKGE